MNCYLLTNKKTENATLVREKYYLTAYQPTEEEQTKIQKMVDEWLYVCHYYFHCSADNDGGIDAFNDERYDYAIDASEVVVMNGEPIGIWHKNRLFVKGEDPIKVSGERENVGGWGDISNDYEYGLERKDGKKEEVIAEFEVAKIPFVAPQKPDFVYSTTGTKEGYLEEYNGTDEVVVLPPETLWVGYMCFKNKKNVKKVIAHDKVMFALNAFANCPDLEEVVLPANTTFVQTKLFENCPNLKHINVPEGIITIESGAFLNSGLTSISLPESLKEIEFSAFYGCANLKHVELPANCTKVGYNVFENSGLTSIVLPDSLAKIDDSTFCDCKNLTEITLPKCLQKIGSFAFKGCTALTTIHWPKSLKKVSYMMLDGCTALKDIYYAGSQADWQLVDKEYGKQILENVTVHFAK